MLVVLKVGSGDPQGSVRGSGGSPAKGGIIRFHYNSICVEDDGKIYDYTSVMGFMHLL